MDIFYIIILGIIQGLTEFLPVSSSGHLVIFQELVGFEAHGVLLEVLLHAGTLLSVIVYFWRDIVKINIRYILLIVLASIPAGIVGVIFKNIITTFFDSLFIVGIALLITSLFNFLTDKFNENKSEVSTKGAIVIGLFQALAITPGISRSGSTIFAGVAMGAKREEVAKFSFILSIPVIVGANIIEVISSDITMYGNLDYYIIGMIAAFISGIFAIKILLKLLQGRSFKVFAIYTFLLGLLLLL